MAKSYVSGIRIEYSTHAALKAEAARQDRPMSTLLERYIREGLARDAAEDDGERDEVRPEAE